MKRTHNQPVNLAVTRLFDKVKESCQSRRARMAFKQIVKKPEMAVHTSMAGAIAHYLPEYAEEVNILIYQAKKHDVIDHGQWLSLIAYIVNKPNLTLNIWINAAKNVEDNVTPLRPVIDYINDTNHAKRINTHMVEGSFTDIVNEIGLDKLDVVYNHNPTAYDHDTVESQQTLKECIEYGVRYCIADSTLISLYFKLAIFEIWGVTTTDTVYKNPYFVALQNGMSNQYRYMGFVISLDTFQDNGVVIDDHTRGQLTSVAPALLNCMNIGAPLNTLPSQDPVTGKVTAFDIITYEPDTQVVECNDAGDRVRLKLTDVPTFPNDEAAIECELTVARTLWSLMLYARYLAEFESLVKARNTKAG